MDDSLSSLILVPVVTGNCSRPTAVLGVLALCAIFTSLSK